MKNEIMMKIVHYLYGLGFGGIETMLINIVNEQIKYNHEIYIIILNDVKELSLINSIDSRIKLIFLDKKMGAKNIVPILKLNILLLKIMPDILHLHYAKLYNTILYPFDKKKLCVTMHAMCNKNNSKTLFKFRHIYAISNIVKQDIKLKCGVESTVILNGIQPELFKCKKNKILESGQLKMVQIGRLKHEEKGQHILLRTIAVLKSNGILNLSVDFIGNGESYQYLVELSEQLKISDMVNFLGVKDQKYIQEHLSDYDLFVQPSVFEGFGLTVAEAMAAKVPLLVAGNQGPMEIINNGQYGYYFNNGDVQDCAKKIKSIIENGVDEKMIVAAYDRVYELYNVKRTALDYLHQYQILNH